MLGCAIGGNKVQIRDNKRLIRGITVTEVMSDLSHLSGFIGRGDPPCSNGGVTRSYWGTLHLQVSEASLPVQKPDKSGMWTVNPCISVDFRCRVNAGFVSVGPGTSGMWLSQKNHRHANWLLHVTLNAKYEDVSS